MTNPLPTFEELQQRGPVEEGRVLTVEEMQQAKIDKANKPDRNKTKRQSESLCKRQFKKFFGVKLVKVRDDLMDGPHGHYRVSSDVDFRGDMPLLVNGIIQVRPVRVECKGITVKANKKGVHGWAGRFSLSRISKTQRQYLEENRLAGGLSILFLSYHLEGKVVRTYIVSWKGWLDIEEELRLIKSPKNFQGKSLRTWDLELLNTSEVFKRNARWQLCRDHWIIEHLPDINVEAEQLSLLDI